MRTGLACLPAMLAYCNGSGEHWRRRGAPALVIAIAALIRLAALRD